MGTSNGAAISRNRAHAVASVNGQDRYKRIGKVGEINLAEKTTQPRDLESASLAIYHRERTAAAKVETNHAFNVEVSDLGNADCPEGGALIERIRLQ